ncbi:MAG: serine hydrolase, partial [Bacteroidota bacterium]
MKLPNVIFLLLISWSYTSYAQPSIPSFTGSWEGLLPDPSAFHFGIYLEEKADNVYQLTIANDKVSIEKELLSTSKNQVELSIDPHTQLSLTFSANKEKLVGFIKSGVLLYHIDLIQYGDGIYGGDWKPLLVKQLQDASIFLDVGEGVDGSPYAYPFIGDQRFSGFWAMDFNIEENSLFFRCFKTGMHFRATPIDDQMQLDMLFANTLIASTTLKRSTSAWQFSRPTNKPPKTIRKPRQLNDGWITADLSAGAIDAAPLKQMMVDIADRKFPNTHSVLIAKRGELVFEKYFDGYKAPIPHDTRSASKSIASAMIGIAIDDQILEGVDQKLYDYIPQAYQYTKDDLKAEITLHHLLTMSAGLDVNGKASEGTYQESDNWLKTTLEAPLKHEPGTYTDYGSANPFLLGVCLNEELEVPLATYMDRRLFQPLGIKNYIIQTEDTQTAPYFGGGMHLTSR